MEVILKQDMDNLGYADEIVKVRPVITQLPHSA